MMKMGVRGAAAVALLHFFCTTATAALLSLPPNEISLAVKPATVTFFEISLSGVPAGYSVANKTYGAWCVDRYNDFDPSADGGLHSGYLLDVMAGGLPAQYQDVPWDKINYLLNHKRGTVDDVQNAIWFFTDGITPEPALTVAHELIAETEANGSGFVPGPNQLSAALIVWTAPNPAAQGNIIEVPGTPDVIGEETCQDRFTAGGFIYRDGSKVTFGIQGGVKNGSLAGGINLVDHGLKLHVRGRTITSYTALDANCREAIYECTINGEPGTATVVACDYGEPGREDVIEITLSNGYVAGQASTLGGDRKGGGNVQLHKGACNEPAKAKPNTGGKPPKKPSVGNGNGNGKPADQARGQGKGAGKGKAKAKGSSGRAR